MSRNQIYQKSIRRKNTSTTSKSNLKSSSQSEKRKKKSKINKLMLFIFVIGCWIVILGIVIGVMFTYKSFTENNLNELNNSDNNEYLMVNEMKQFDLDEELNDTDNKSSNKKSTVNENKKQDNKTKIIDTDYKNKNSENIVKEVKDDNINIFTKTLNVFTGKNNIKPVKLPFEEKYKKNHTIFIDASFGGTENGYTTKNGVKAKDITLSLAKKVNKELSKHSDIDVVMSRMDDIRLSSDERLDLINNSNADLMVSIRTNGQSSGFTATGIECYFNEENNYSKESFNLANIVQDMTLNYVDAKKRYIINANFDILNKSNMPSIIIQTGFITTPSDEKNLTNEKYQDELASGIAQGILNYIDNYLK